MKRVVLFAGTIEGRTLSEYLSSQGVPVIACVATEYGETLMAENPCLTVRRGRMDREEMVRFLKEESPELAVDCTHPYAALVSANLSAACEETGTEYLRLIRESRELMGDEAVCVASVDEAVEYLKGTEGNILATTGSKELAKYTAIPDYKTRVFARVLSTGEVASACEKLGFCGKNLICMQGPFSEELNTAMLRQFHCTYLVTKETGKAGGFEEKIRAAKKAGAQVVLVGRPPEQEGKTSEQVIEYLKERFHLEDRKTEGAVRPEPAPEKAVRRITLAGIGMGSVSGLTGEARAAIREAELLIGAKRMLETAAELLGGPEAVERVSSLSLGETGRVGEKTVCHAYDAEKIADYLEDHPEYQRTALLLSGDIGFYSGAKKLYETLEKRFPEAELQSLCGISSVVYFCGKLKTPWEDVCLKSTHGRNANLAGAVRTHRKTFTLLGAKDSVGELCRELTEYGLSHVRLYIGERLGYPDERIVSGTPQELKDGSFGGLCVALIENPSAESKAPACLEDESFLRGKAPMTKSEVRSVSVAKLRLPKDAVVYDVGAGTGSVSVELALQAVDGQVYAIERSGEACELIEQNKRRFGTPNIQVVRGLAPEAMEGLPRPSHAFIGGSAGNLKEILQCLLEKNPQLRIVINTVTLETLTEVLDCLKKLPLVEEEILSMSVAKARELGAYHLMTGQNPIYIITCRGGKKE